MLSSCRSWLLCDCSLTVESKVQFNSSSFPFTAIVFRSVRNQLSALCFRIFFLLQRYAIWECCFNLGSTSLAFGDCYPFWLLGYTPHCSGEIIPYLPAMSCYSGSEDRVLFSHYQFEVSCDLTMPSYLQPELLSNWDNLFVGLYFFSPKLLSNFIKIHSQRSL